MEREKISINSDLAENLSYENYDESCGFEVVLNRITGTSRWTSRHELVIKRLSDGKFFRDFYSKGLTEYQDESPFEYSEPDFQEVFPVEKTIIVYE